MRLLLLQLVTISKPLFNLGWNYLGGKKKILNSEYTAFSTLRKKKKRRWEYVAVSVEWEISLTTYTSATITVLDCCTNNGFLGRVKYV